MEKLNKKTLDSDKTIAIHKSLIESKVTLKQIYEKFYGEFRKTKLPKGKILELGSGGGFLKKVIPKVITSDVVKGNGIDKVFFAEKLPFKNGELSGIFMLNVLHHIKNPEKALREMERCLKGGGKIKMIEPYNSIWSKFIYENFHHELFDPNSSWKVEGNGRLSDANDAIPWIIFVRDRKVFEKKFPKLKINRVTPHTPFAYLLFGNLSKPQFLPSFMYPYIESLEEVLTPFNEYLGLFVTIELTKLR
jgi:SAM-dependent methyltransferase